MTWLGLGLAMMMKFRLRNLSVVVSKFYPTLQEQRSRRFHHHTPGLDASKRPYASFRVKLSRFHEESAVNQILVPLG